MFLFLKEMFRDVVNYGLPLIAIVISSISLFQSHKSSKLQNRINVLEEKNKLYELEEREKEKENATKACIEARVYNISKGKYALKIWNSGKAKAYDVDYRIGEGYSLDTIRQKVPYEFLEAGKSFEEHAIVHSGTSRKFIIVTEWKNEIGESFHKEQMCSL